MEEIAEGFIRLDFLEVVNATLREVADAYHFSRNGEDLAAGNTAPYWGIDWL
jgi:hypothetical protein